jgi:catalase
MLAAARLLTIGLATGGAVLLCMGCAPRRVVEQPPGAADIDPEAAPLPPFDPPTAGAEALNTEFYLGDAAQEAATFARFAEEIQTIQARQSRAHAQGPMRGFHAKAHGCLTGWFQLFPDRDPRTRFGVFEDDAAPWPVWARLSNGVGWRQTDNELDARGLAVKLMGVPGPKLLDEESGTQDFLMTNSPTPVGRDAFDFMKFAAANSRTKAHGLWFAATHARTGGAALLDTGPIPSMVAEQYWSGGAFHLGAHQAVKFTAKPCSTARARLPSGSGPDRLRQDLAEAAMGGLCFNFYVQFQTDAFRTPIEDASREWLESDSPLVPVGKLTFPAQDLAEPGRDQLCERLSYNPWHGIAAHQPMGHINRARRFVYAASRAHRQGGFEPVNFDVPTLPAPATTVAP